MTTASTDKLNLRLVRASDYIQRFELEFRHKPGKQHIVPNALFRLPSDNASLPSQNGELDALFTTVLVEMEEGFRKKVVDGYRSDQNWKKILEVLDKSAADSAKLPFYRES